MTNVQQLVHLAYRKDPIDEDLLRAERLTQRRRAYEDELTIQAARVGCPGRVGRLGNNAILNELNDMSNADAASIVNTFNYDLARAIIQIGEDVPTANRYVYSSRLQDWEAARSEWKDKDITQYTESSARALAQQDFYQYNGGIMGYAVLEPGTAACPVCQGWIERGEVPLHEAQNHPPPYHTKCPHRWRTVPDRIAAEECPLLWMGE
jgi:hypothetical protein